MVSIVCAELENENFFNFANLTMYSITSMTMSLLCEGTYYFFDNLEDRKLLLSLVALVWKTHLGHQGSGWPGDGEKQCSGE